jgi:hypothetical protein
VVEGATFSRKHNGADFFIVTPPFFPFIVCAIWQAVSETETTISPSAPFVGYTTFDRSSQLAHFPAKDYVHWGTSSR